MPTQGFIPVARPRQLFTPRDRCEQPALKASCMARYCHGDGDGAACAGERCWCNCPSPDSPGGFCHTKVSSLILAANTG